MKKKFIRLLVLVLSPFTAVLYGQQMDPQMEAFISRMDSASLEELEAELNVGLEALRLFEGFFGNGTTEVKSIAKEDENYGEPFKIDTSIASLALKQFQNIGFQQTFANDQSFIEFEKIGNDYWNRIWLEEGMTERFTPKSVFYKDGSTVTNVINDYEVNFSWEKPWGKVAIIDSIEVNYTLNYAKKYDSLVLSKKTNKIKYKDGIIKLEKLEGNYCYLTISDAYSNGLIIRARNAQGKIISFRSGSYSYTSDKKSKADFSKMVGLLEDISAKLKAKKFKDTDALKKHLLKKVAKLEVAKDNDGVRHNKYHFNGNIESIELYISEETASETVTFTAKNNNSFDDILLLENKTETVFLDADANEIFRTPSKPLERIGERLFVTDDAYFHLNTINKSLDSLQAVNAYETKNGLLFIQPTTENGFLTFDLNLMQLSELEFTNVWSVDHEYAHAIDEDDNIYALSTKGDIDKIEGVTKVMDFSEGLVLAKNNNQYGFINPSGKVVVPCIYKEAEYFSEGLAVVKNEEDLYGFINKKGEITLPFIYNRAISFENGIALVSNGNSYQLIDKTGKVVVTSNSNGYSTNWSGVKKTYQFGDKKYDAFGKLISEEK